jgi:cellulose synthase/poly-beta-1,6-N-acetylglucosamine synthase-like glycosyltransferase
MKFSIITWDASFREFFHTIDSFGKQSYENDLFEFFLCDYYDNNKPQLKNKIKKYKNFNQINLNNEKKTKWHLGKTINSGIKKSIGEILIIPDGDIIVPEDFLTKVEKIFNNSSPNLVCYFRRWDEPKEKHCEKSYDIKYLEESCELRNMTNYGGCFAIRRDVFEEIGFYEEHEVFLGPGANGMELYKRFRNKGLQIMWSDIKVYHPFHSFTGSSDKVSQDLIIASKVHNWINPYMGLKQSWVLKQRDQYLDWKANDKSIDLYLKNLHSLRFYLPQKAKITYRKRLTNFIFRKINNK